MHGIPYGGETKNLPIGGLIGRMTSRYVSGARQVQRTTVEWSIMERSPKEAKVNGLVGIVQQQERQLIAAARSGDRSAVRKLIDLHKDRLFSFIFRMIRNHHDAEDVCQDAFLKAFASLDSYSKEYRFSTWLFTIGYRVCLNRMRRKKALTGEVDVEAFQVPSFDAVPETLQSEEAGQLKDQVWQAVDELSPPQRAAVLLFYRCEMGCHEISRVLELPVATVKSHLHRARLRLRELLESMSETDLRQYRNQVG